MTTILLDADHPARAVPALAQAVAALDDALPLGGRLSPAAAHRAALDACYQAYQAGRAAALRELLTSEEAAATLGITIRHLRLLAARHDVGWRIGRDILFRPEDLERLRQRETQRGPKPRRPD